MRETDSLRELVRQILACEYKRSNTNTNLRLGKFRTHCRSFTFKEVNKLYPEFQMQNHGKHVGRIWFNLKKAR